MTSEDFISSYSYGEKNINFNRCSQCGCVTHYTLADASPDSKLAINYRMFDSSILKKITLRTFDGANTWKYLD
ncbi:hypothetical protein [Agarilytica rhodophyticola]|uniref:hypothetical protein n=1 Tax=Agarilytica rhodophyticola TaxID=1737490 RepID=UPI001C1F9E79|nr:hypothetical protein [Agarilytica rhodophyticola]